MTPEEFFAVEWPEPQAVFYRLYHDINGRPLFYSMEDVPGTYIEIDQATYARNCFWVCVINGQLVERPWYVPQKLQPGTQGQDCHLKDVAIITGRDRGQKWSINNSEQS